MDPPDREGITAPKETSGTPSPKACILTSAAKADSALFSSRREITDTEPFRSEARSLLTHISSARSRPCGPAGEYNRGDKSAS